MDNEFIEGERDKERMNITDTIRRGIEVPIKEFYLVETELYTVLYAMKDKPDFVYAFLGLSSWMGTSLRGGAWTYYESANKNEIDTVIKYLRCYDPENAIAGIYAMGNHDYGDEKYQDNFEYPQEWIEESEKIDKWIFDNEETIIRFMQDILKNNIDYFSEFTM